MAYTPNKWGPAATNRDYHFFMAGPRPGDPLISLLEHSLTSPSQELSDPVTIPEERIVNGRRTVFQRVVQPAQQTGMTYTLLFPSSLWTPALDRARRSNGCETDFFALRTCEDPQYEHAYIYPDAILDPPTEVGDFISLDDGTVVQEQTTLRVGGREILWGLRANVVMDVTTPLYAVGFNTPDCAGCIEGIYTDAFAGGGDGTAVGYAASTGDRFATISAGDLGLPAGAIITSQWSQGDLVLVGWSDEADPATATIGGTAFSSDNGVTATLNTDVIGPIFGVTFAFGQYVAVGGTGLGIGRVFVSSNGIQWEEVVSAAIVGTDSATAVAADDESGTVYVVGEGGQLWKGTFTGGTIAFADISANLPGTPGTLRAVSVLAQDRIVVGGADGYAAESTDGGASFHSIAVPGTGVIRAMAGSKYRLVVGIGNRLWERSIITRNAFREIVVADGVVVAGNYTSLAIPPRNAYSPFNYFYAATDQGEVVMLRPSHPLA